jgi:hypothetical protein
MTSAVALRGKGDPGGGHGGVLREAVTEAMRAKTDEPSGIKSKMDDVAEALAAVRVLIVSTASNGENGREIAAR